ncbi:MAG TPA: cellulase family glycosylhydrolase [Gemmataceae bacterium]|jgi:hypothetical protein
MPVSLTCPACAASFTLADDLRGKKAVCPRCGRKMVIPSAGAAKRDERRAAVAAAPRHFPRLWLVAALLAALTAGGIGAGILVATHWPGRHRGEQSAGPSEQPGPAEIDSVPPHQDAPDNEAASQTIGTVLLSPPTHQDAADNGAAPQTTKPDLISPQKPQPGPPQNPSGPLPPLKVVGTYLTTPDGKVARLRGVNLPTLEWGQGENLFRSLDVCVDEWKVNFIRLTVSQDRWFGHTKERKDGGARYRQTVREFVKRAAAKRCYVLLNLHFIDPGVWLDEDVAQKGQYLVWTHKMPDDHSVDFWASAAKEFANHPAVLFDLYNEPGNVSWAVWRDGGNLVEKHKNAPGGKWEYHSPGMQKLVDTCRAQGAKNIVVAEGLQWGYDLSGIVKGFALKDPGGNGVAYSTHIYGKAKDGPNGLEVRVTPAVKEYAVLIGEFCAGKSNSVDPVVSYADQYQLPWLAWCMHPGIKPRLIENWKYQPTPYGESVKKALLEAAKR